jgi:hypothetical protein
MKKYIVIILVTLCFVGCSSTKKAIKTKDKQDTTQVVKPKPQAVKPKPIEKLAPYKTYTCKFSCTYNNIPLRGTMRNSYDSIVWISVNVLGVEQARCLITKDSVFVLNKAEKDAYACDYKRVTSLVGLPLSLSFVQELFIDTIANKTFNTPKFSATIKKQSQNVTKTLRLPYDIDLKAVINKENKNLHLKIKDQEINTELSFPYSVPSGYKIYH